MFSFFGFPTKTNVSSSTQEKQDEQQQEEGNIESTDPSTLEPPMFPAQNSIQRAASSSGTKPTPSQPPITTHPILRIDSPPPDEDEEYEEYMNNQNNDDRDYYDQDNDLDLDLNALSLPHSTRKKPAKPRKKVQLMPGFSQLDWAKLKSSGVNLRGEEVTSIRRISRTELSEHKTKEDCWSSFNGKVYNMTAYLNYHPGGVRELMRVAGKDGTELFMKTHAWISVDAMLDTCLVGFLVND
ncbi:hypothetical protein MJO29_015592 [Puccinia striiformis f. sp. tritici]|uniref:Cytochrome b5 heme-binding domain-containing protein n=1 Tax=Puccinia striiformis TaxID=27350 RepID=A0A2S4WH34_9BASI|nr:hypothetical protein Pst134EB_029886 [Puccinia striiformis f. sp. tritici]KAI7936289.1 hypothetical protein MJO29_015592 [Puccinia striiformis f. sp. tritici]KAI9630881.1 hypothetical protein KEM48_013498 [Puccinia striiformis f. sp. tritici PST-130]POW21105.1 hypothetical protein PSHT_02798 [Puccinia striiformis]